MFTLFVIAVAILIIGTLAIKQASIPVWTVTLLIGMFLYSKHSGIHLLSAMEWIIAIVVLVPLSIKMIRLRFITPWIFTQYKRALPKISKTEREALTAGTVSWEGDLFNGAPDFNKLLAQPAAVFSQEEQAFLEGPVKELCRMIDDWEITHDLMDLPPQMWQFIKKHGFLGMIIPKQYGGLEFSASAVAAVLLMVYGKSISVATTISVPNSLGPGELLLKYGTPQQKDHYLPRLAKGEEIPCFALTNPEAGSDAASIPDRGIICHKIVDGHKTLGINLNWDKRYITLCPVATVIGLAFRLFDPDHLLGSQEDLGITCALIPATTAGITRGRRHFPLNIAFMNGPTQGKDVFIPLDWIIGGPKMAGNGWRMLMECLSAGRAISLPSSAIGGAQVSMLTGSAYARVRKQFNTPIGKFEGIETLLARSAANTYIINAALSMTAAAIDQGAEPAVASAIVKYHTTELARKILKDACDIHGGKAICLGPKNYLGRTHQGIPISITVEGANILTRNLIIFGQGAIRCHRYVFEEMESGNTNDLPRFDGAFFGHAAMFINNAITSLLLGVSDGHLVRVPAGPLKHYMQLMRRYSANLSFMADFAMMVLGASLKRRERISARLGDVLSYLYLCSAVIKHYHDEGKQQVDLPVVELACQQLLFDIETTIEDIIHNFPNRWLRLLLKVVLLPTGSRRYKPSDTLQHTVGNIVLTDSDTRQRLTKNVFKEALANNPVGRLEDAFKQILAVTELEHKVSQAVKQRLVSGLSFMEQIDAAAKQDIITKAEANELRQAELARKAVIAVDDFDHKELARNVVTDEAPVKKPKPVVRKRQAE